VHAATFFVWITFSAAFICLFSNMLLLRWFSTHFARKIVDSLSKLRECLIMSLDKALSTSREGESGFLGTRVASRQKKLLDELLAESIQLDLAYSIAAFELRLGRVDGRLIFSSRLRVSKYFPSCIYQTSHCGRRKRSQGTIVGLFTCGIKSWKRINVPNYEASIGPWAGNSSVNKAC
jgi:hypothetical protein